MKILITGASGQLGHDCAKILATEHTIYPLSLRELDISDRQQVERILGRINPDTVINCAAYTAVDACETDMEQCRRVNSEGPGYLAVSCADLGARLLHISTDYVFDGSKPVPEPYSENDLVCPVSDDDLKRPAPRPRNSRLACLCSEERGFDPLPDWEDAVDRFLKREQGVVTLS